MKITILTTSYKRPLLLDKLSDSIIPLINKHNGQLEWKIIIDDIDKEYDLVLDEINKKIKNKNLISCEKHENIGKFRSLNKLFNKKTDSEWLVNIDDDDLIINFKFDNFIRYLDRISKDVKAIIVPRLILNTPFYYLRFHYKTKLFSKCNNQKMSYFEFKEKFGDYDTTVFVRKSYYSNIQYLEVENDKFTPESLRWLDAYPKKDILILKDLLIYSQYLSDGITKYTDKNRILNSQSTIVTYKKFLEYKKFNLSSIFIKSLINYYRFNFHANKKINILNDDFGNLVIRFFGITFGKILFLYDRFFFKK